jgi:hypothetical protein
VEDEPLCIRTILPYEGKLTIRDVLASQHFELYFFDDLTREMLNFSIFNTDKRIANLNFVPQEARGRDDAKIIQNFNNWFSNRTDSDDKNAMTIKLKEVIYEPRIIMDLTHPNIGLITSELERTIAGKPQEQDIAIAFQNNLNCVVYLNPEKQDSKKEICDVLISLDNKLIIVQAKDSPNIEATITSRSIERKIKSVQKHIVKASKQLKGAISYIQKQPTFSFICNDRKVELPLSSISLIGLIVVTELIDYGFDSENVLKVSKETGVSCVLLEHSRLLTLLHHSNNNQEFLGILETIVAYSQEHNCFPNEYYLKRS